MMNIILLTFICTITISYVQDLLLHDIVKQRKAEKPTASLLRAPGSVNPHAVFNYSPFSSISRY